MKILKLTLFYLAIIVLAMTLSLAGVRMSVALGVFALIAGIMIFNHLNLLYLTNNMKIVDTFVKEKKKQPIFGHAYAIAYGTKEDELRALDVLIQKFKQPAIKCNYMFIKAIVEHNIGAAKEAANQLHKEPIKSYAKSYIAAIEGRKEDIQNKQLTKAWMEPAIEAIYAHTKGNHNDFRHYADSSIALARGVQKYTLIHSFEKMEKELTLQSEELDDKR